MIRTFDFYNGIALFTWYMLNRIVADVTNVEHQPTIDSSGFYFLFVFLLAESVAIAFGKML